MLINKYKDKRVQIPLNSDKFSEEDNIEDSVNDFVNRKKNETYDNWKQGVLSKLNIDQERKEQMDELIGLGTALPGAVRGGYKAYKAYQAKKKGTGQTEDDTTGSDSTGSTQGSDKAGEKVKDEPDENTSSSQPDVEDDN